MAGIVKYIKHLIQHNHNNILNLRHSAIKSLKMR